MRSQSVKQSLIIYAIVVLLGATFGLTTYASFRVIDLHSQSQKKIAEQQLRGLLHGVNYWSIAAKLKQYKSHDFTKLSLVTQTENDSEYSWTALQAELRKAPDKQSKSLLILRIPNRKGALVVASLDSKYAFNEARETIRSLLILSVLLALVGGGLIAWLSHRIVLKPLSSLQDLVEDDHKAELGLESEHAPNEVAKVAQAFRTTIRTLREERNQVEEKHMELQEAQAAMNQAAKLASLGRVAAGIAHEIGNPLAAVKGYLSLVQRGLEASEQEEVLERCVAELQRIHDTIRQLLTYARPDNRPQERTLFDTSQILAEVLELLKNHPELRQVAITQTTTEGHQAFGVPESFRQIVLNVMINAGHALKGHRTPKITVSLFESETHQSIHIRDNGPGVDLDMKEQVFDPFFTTKSPGEGTGLGLAVSRAMALNMGGNLYLGDPDSESEESGAEFVLELPRAP